MQASAPSTRESAGGICAAGGRTPRRDRRCRVSTGDGTELFVRDVGDGRPVVFVHSWTLASEMWRYQEAALLARGYRCIAFDRRGHGQSDDPGRGYDLDTLAGDLGAVLEAVDLRGVTLVAHSFGCLEALRFVSRFDDGRVDALALVSTTTPCLLRRSDNPDGIDAAAFAALRDAWREDFPAWIDANTAPFFTPATGPGTIGWLTGMMLRTPLHVAIACNETMVAADSRADLARVRIPTLVVHGDSDASSPLPLTGAATAAGIPHAVFKVYEGAPHGLFVTHAKRLNGDLLDFLEGVSRDDAARSSARCA